MIMLSCHLQERGLLQSTSAFDLSRQVRVALCCFYYMSHAVKLGAPLLQVRQDEWTLRDEMHEYLAFLPGVKMKRGLESRCDVCALIDVVRRMAFAQDGDEFILSTRKSEVERAKFDWVAAFDDFAYAADLKGDAGFGRKIERAQVVMHFVQEFTPAVFVENAEPQLITMVRKDNVIRPEELLRLAHYQIKALRHGHLRLIG